jgi:hypothetical protein
MPMIYPCSNHEACGQYVERPGRLCRDCKAAADELNKRIKRLTDEEILAVLETKPRTWRDAFRKVTR